MMIKKTMLGIALCSILPFVSAVEPPAGVNNSPSLSQVTRAENLVSTIAPTENFTGQVRVQRLFPANETINSSASYVTFEAGARSAWHTHPAGQRLIVTSGIGLTQEEGKPVQEIRAGDIVWCPPGVKHWHGASSNSEMTHLAITGVVDNKSVDWMEKVNDDEYNAR